MKKTVWVVVDKRTNRMLRYSDCDTDAVAVYPTKRGAEDYCTAENTVRRAILTWDGEEL